MGLISILTWLALAAWLALATWWWWGLRTLRRLEPLAVTGAPVAPDAPGGWPSLSLVVAARDERQTIVPALRTWLAQDYPAFEIVIVDDRSGDGTLAAVEAVLAEHAGPVEQAGRAEHPARAEPTAAGGAPAALRSPRVRTLRIEALPEGWLGKPHAQAAGARAATGEWLLLADADVRLAPSAARAAMAAALGAAADHLALLPRFDVPGGGWRAHLVLAFETAFALLLTVLLRPWRAPDAGSPATLGIGAFGLYRRAALDRAGGLEAVRLRPDDDLALALSVKAAGGRSLVVFAPRLAAVSWYTSLGDALRGLEKNAFAGLRFSLPRVALVSLGLLWTHVLPFGVALLAAGDARAAGIGVALVVTVVYIWYGRRAGTPGWYALLHPVSVLALVAALLRSTFAALVTGRIAWRGTSYEVAELRAALRDPIRDPVRRGTARAPGAPARPAAGATANRPTRPRTQ
jgi:GT2 family glycosyltransferase